MLQLPLTTARLELRALTEDDVEHHHRLFGDPAVVRYPYELPLTRDEAVAHLATRLDPRLPGQGAWLNLAVFHEGRFLGEVGASLRRAEHRQCEVGYIFVPEAGGQGYATESATAMVELCFDHLDAHRVAARSTPATPLRRRSPGDSACVTRPTCGRTSGSRAHGPTRRSTPSLWTSGGADQSNGWRRSATTHMLKYCELAP